MTGTLGHPDEMWALAARLADAADARKMLRVAADQARYRLEARAVAALWRDRRSGRWRAVASSGSGLATASAALLEDPAAREPIDDLKRTARPLRPFGRLAGGVVVRRDDPPLRRRDAEWLGRFARVVSADLVRREQASWERWAYRLYAKLAHGARPLDVIYQGLGVIARASRADHSVTLVGPDSVGSLVILAEKICRPGERSPRVGRRVSSPEDPTGLPSDLLPPAHRELVGLDRWAHPGAVVTVRVVSGDPLDGGDRGALACLAGPIAAASARI
jgi:hypothetical protein